MGSNNIPSNDPSRITALDFIDLMDKDASITLNTIQSLKSDYLMIIIAILSIFGLYTITILIKLTGYWYSSSFFVLITICFIFFINSNSYFKSKSNSSNIEELNSESELQHYRAQPIFLLFLTDLSLRNAEQFIKAIIWIYIINAVLMVGYLFDLKKIINLIGLEIASNQNITVVGKLDTISCILSTHGTNFGENLPVISSNIIYWSLFFSVSIIIIAYFFTSRTGEVYSISAPVILKLFNLYEDYQDELEENSQMAYRRVKYISWIVLVAIFVGIIMTILAIYASLQNSFLESDGLLYIIAAYFIQLGIVALGLEYYGRNAVLRVLYQKLLLTQEAKTIVEDELCSDKYLEKINQTAIDYYKLSKLYYFSKGNHLIFFPAYWIIPSPNLFRSENFDLYEKYLKMRK